jgi:hypothetical protein
MAIRKKLPAIQDATDLVKALMRELDLLEFNSTEYGEYNTTEEMEYAVHVTLLLHATSIKGYLRLNASKTFKERFLT